ncbi:nicotinate phosphoribosyltransferase [Priestia megaterium]|uniref:nicotinate phosphoribosyltransferase n=1 Tax=Priestia megaterium TaxID=1404 RepID=UPI000BFB2695|nr:nicotinate phosphoribosyltransferase [Priestia megaterium]PGO60641.1 nicotinate phosphoribosyltransferase [Priestia megaterium]
MKNFFVPATLLCDFYKVSHKDQYPLGTEVVYSTWTPRSNKYMPYADAVVTFGIQGLVKAFIINFFNENFFNRPKAEVVAEYVRVLKHTLGKEPNTTHIEELHDLGYLPIEIKALDEGTLAPIKTPMMTIENTDKRFFWLPNFLETIISNIIWQPMTSATIAYSYRKLLNKYAMETVGHTQDVGFQGHDFSMRGMGGFDATLTSGAGHLLSFTGTDTIPAIMYHEEYYNANIEKELVGASIPATEHSVMSANTSADIRDEYETFKRLITEVYPEGFVSIVSDTYDFWKVVGEVLPKLKDDIMARNGRVVIRPDSGIPEDIICGTYIEDLTDENYPDTKPEDMIDHFSDVLHSMDLCGDGYHGDENYTFKFKLDGKYYEMDLSLLYNRHDKRYYYIEEINMKRVQEFTPSLADLGLIEALWNIFGGTISEKGYKVLDTHIGAIYGDSITLERAETIVRRLKEKGFASTNIVLGIGSYTYQCNTRDSLGFAMKATYMVENGVEKLLFKDPKTDDGTKRSQRGRVVVYKNTVGDIMFEDGQFKADTDALADIDLLTTVFKDGVLVKDHSLAEIRNRLHNGNI